MFRYDEVKWEQAACDGMPLNLFYVFEEQQHIRRIFDVDIVRKTCFTCPIWQQCLSYALVKERHGIWGGLTTAERSALVKGSPATAFASVMNILLNAAFGIKQIQELISEYSDYQRSLENAITD